ncbi:MAG: tetratricopeptide repeat protein [Chloroflexota bacterium]
MFDKKLLEAATLLETLYQLSDLQQELLIGLQEKGPGLLLELAVQVLRFPDEISQPVAELRNLDLIKTNRFSGSSLGSEVLMLTDLGYRMVELLRNEQMRQELEQLYNRTASKGKEPNRIDEARSDSESTLSYATDSASLARQQEFELLNKLGDLARDEGDIKKARTYYEQALSITQTVPNRQRSAGPNWVDSPADSPVDSAGQPKTKENESDCE